jgi:hypothetical protein
MVAAHPLYDHTCGLASSASLVIPVLPLPDTVGPGALLDTERPLLGDMREDDRLQVLENIQS